MRTPHAVSRAAILVAPLAALILTAPTPAAGQARAPEGTTVRVIETVDPATGESRRSPVAHLGPAEVRAIQDALARVGEPGAATGRLDAPTLAALRRFQERRGLAPCGCPSYETLLALGLEPRVVEIVVRAAGPGGPASTAGAAVADVQVVYGTPPRRPAAGAGEGPGAQAEADREGAAGGSAEPSGPAADQRFLFDDRGFFFPVFIDSPFFGRKVEPGRAEPAPGGIPLGRRQPGPSPLRLGTRAPPR